MKKPYHRQYQYKKRKSIFRSSYFWFLMLLIIVACGFCYLIYLSPVFQIKNINISGNEKVNGEEAFNSISRRIENTFLLLPSKSIFLADLESMSKDFMQEFPQVRIVNLRKGLPDQIFVSIEERKPVAVFSQNRIILFDANQSKNQESLSVEELFYLDKEGTIFESISDKDDFVKITKSQTDTNYVLGDQVIDEKILSEIMEIDPKLKLDLKISIQDFDLQADDWLVVRAEDNWQMYFNPQEDVKWQLTKLKAVLEEKIPSEKRKDLEYIDLRFGNLAPYKYR